MLLLSLLLLAQDTTPPANRARILPLEWADASKFADMAPCSLRPVELGFARTHTSLGGGYIRGDADLRHAYLVSARILSDAAVTRDVHEGLSWNAIFAPSFPKGAGEVRLATDRMGSAREARSIIVLLASEKPIEAIACDAFATQ